jgi:hypothetical protein
MSISFDLILAVSRWWFDFETKNRIRFSSFTSSNFVVEKEFCHKTSNSNLCGSVTLNPTTRLEVVKRIMATDDKALRYPFRRVKGNFLDLSDKKLLQHADKRYILHICRQRFRHLGEKEEREETMMLLGRYRISPRNINYWLNSEFLMDNIDAMDHVPALKPPFSPLSDGKFDNNVQKHPKFDMDYIISYYMAHHKVLLLSCGLMESWYGISHSTVDYLFKAMMQRTELHPERTQTLSTTKRQKATTKDQSAKPARRKKSIQSHTPQPEPTQPHSTTKRQKPTTKDQSHKQAGRSQQSQITQHSETLLNDKGKKDYYVCLVSLDGVVELINFQLSDLNIIISAK